MRPPKNIEKGQPTATMDKDGITIYQDRFAQLVASGHSLTESYMQAFNMTNENSARSSGPRLAKNPRIVNKINAYRQEIHNDFVKEVSYSYKDAMREANEALEMARDQGAPQAMKGIIELKCKLTNLIDNKPTEHKPDTLESLDDKLAKLIAKAEVKQDPNGTKARAKKGE